MGFLDRLLGRSAEPTIRPNTLRPPRPVAPPDSDHDSAALERYRYLLRTAPPEELEKAHVEAFERLDPEQRSRVRQDLEAAVPTSEAPASADPRDLARAATRAEVRAPGTLERAFGGSFLHTFAAVFVATSMADMLLGGFSEPYGTDAGSETAGTGAEGDLGSDLGSDLDSDSFGGFGDFGGFDI